MANIDNIFDTGFWLFDGSIDIVLAFEFGHDFMILKWVTITNDYIEIEPAHQSIEVRLLARTNPIYL